MSSLEKLLLPLTILESLISLLWFLSGILFETEINDDSTSSVDKQELNKTFTATNSAIITFFIFPP